ncbi:carbon-nitrogen hydrolase family protein [Vibrio sonorensis]|uniref:carbon-nitrogen hydrolase family protein n=1 Tax=Vibrio sonorensis TaxID=1004316 RepID=UPI0008DAF82A|nr:carbon-nitrogen hydrolase family protein [Vibrio sonorensis]
MERIAIIQMTSGADPVENLDYISQQLSLAAEQNADLVLIPENALVFGSKADYYRHAEVFEQGILQTRLSLLAQQHQVYLVVGSMPIKREDKVSTSSIVFDDTGKTLAIYDKLHMFDVDVSDGHRHYRESETFVAGNEVVVSQGPDCRLGLTICYDLRFPALYSELVRLGANVILVPAAFTAVTGKAHWLPLLRARAIETQSWVVAANQTGKHPCGRETWGHSMVIDPWGEVVASLDQEKGLLLADIDLKQVDKVRQSMPVLNHNRFTAQLINKS